MKNLAWHFVGLTLRDGKPIPKDGKWLEYSGELKLCSTGLHFSRLPHQALQYAPGATLCLVEVGGEIIEPQGENKGVCSRRKIIACMDATELLRFYARMQAVKALEYWNTEPPEVICDYLMTGDEDIRAAARAAASAAARAVARAAARDAAWDAARYAARYAARDAAWAVARYAARDAARAAARAVASAAAWYAARYAAWDADSAAARDAAWDAANAEFDELVYECFSDFLPKNH